MNVYVFVYHYVTYLIFDLDFHSERRTSDTTGIGCGCYPNRIALYGQKGPRIVVSSPCILTGY
mgnify:CR=1 FL=1